MEWLQVFFIVLIWEGLNTLLKMVCVRIIVACVFAIKKLNELERQKRSRLGQDKMDQPRQGPGRQDGDSEVKKAKTE